MRFFASLISVALLSCACHGQTANFELVVTGELASKLEPDAMVTVSAIGKTRVSMAINFENLPLSLPAKHYRDQDVLVKFFSGKESRKHVFTVELDSELFDSPRRINVKLDAPTPVLRPVNGWKYLGYSANITKRMRYVKLPFWDQKLKEFIVIPNPPNLTMANDSGKRSVGLKHYCSGYRWYGVADSSIVATKDSETNFKVVYDSGGAFKRITTSFDFQYHVELHGK